MLFQVPEVDAAAKDTQRAVEETEAANQKEAKTARELGWHCDESAADRPIWARIQALDFFGTEVSELWGTLRTEVGKLSPGAAGVCFIGKALFGLTALLAQATQRRGAWHCCI